MISNILFKRTQILMLAGLISMGSVMGCESDVANLVGVSSGGLLIGMKALSGNSGLPTDGTSQATIRVEVFNTAGQLVNGATITLTTTLGTLGDTTLTTANGVGITTLTSGTQPGTAYVVATTENVSATVAVQFVNITGTVT